MAAVLCTSATAIPAQVQAQESKPIQQEGSVWVAYMSDWVLHPRWSIWLDAHYNVRAFGVIRAGLTHHFAAGPSLTAGYAQVWTEAGRGYLDRFEHRPWAQVVFPLRISTQWSFTERVRYDLRIRQNIADGHVTEGWGNYHRVRFQTAITYTLPEFPRGSLFFQLTNEVLFNVGALVGPNYLDQNRLSVLLGWTIRDATIRIGYMDRFSPGPRGTELTHEHGLLLWFNQKIELQRRRAPTMPEASNP